MRMSALLIIKHSLQEVCPYCEHQGTVKSSLKNHIDSVHDGIKFKCSQCEHQASQKSNLKIHIDSVHNIMISYPDSLSLAMRK